MDDRTERRILEKAEYVRESVSLLVETRNSVSFQEYCSDRRERDVVEREFQTSIEACIDIGSMLLRAETGSVPESNADVFRELESIGILEDGTARRMARAAGFRNVLAHRYGAEIDDEDVFTFLQEELDLFPEYLKQVRSALE